MDRQELRDHLDDTLKTVHTLEGLIMSENLEDDIRTKVQNSMKKCVSYIDKDLKNLEPKEEE